jgi:hypothetical protein
MVTEVPYHPSFTFQLYRTYSSFPGATVATGFVYNKRDKAADFNTGNLGPNPASGSIMTYYPNVQASGTNYDLGITAELAGYELSIASLSTAASITNTTGFHEFVDLALSPKTINARVNNVTQVLTYRATGLPYQIPSGYANMPTQFEILNFPFDATVVNNSYQYTKNITLSKAAGSSVIADISVFSVVMVFEPPRYKYFATPTIINSNIRFSYNFPTLSTTGVFSIMYNQNLVIKRFPKATLRGTTIPSLSMAFNESTLQYDERSATTYNSSFYIRPSGAFGQKSYSCSLPDRNGINLNCASVAYNTSMLIDNSYIALYPYFWLYGSAHFATEDVLLSANDLNDDMMKLYYLDQGLVSIISNDKLLLTQQMSNVTIMFNSTFLPSSIINTGFIYCKFYNIRFGKSVNVPVQFVSSTSFKGNNNTYVFNCNKNFDSGMVGDTLITLIYEESDPTKTLGTTTSFILSSNSVSIVMVDPINILAINPGVTSNGVNALVTLSTSFVFNATYTGISFAVRYKYNITDYYYTPMDGSSFSLQQFRFFINGAYPGDASIEIIMIIGSTNYTASTAPSTLKFINGDFISPTYGTVTGNTTAIVYNYGGPPDAFVNITFVGDENIYFPCVRWIGPYNPQLNCTTPAVVGKTPFQSFFTRIGNATLSTKYVVIDTRTILLDATTFSTVGTYTLNITFDSPVTFGSSEGTAVLRVDSTTVITSATENIGVLNGTKSIQRLYSALPKGNYAVTLLYQNPNIFEANSAVAFTNSAPITFIEPVPISFVPITASITLIDSVTSFSIQIDAASMGISQNVACRFDNASVNVISSSLNNNILVCVVVGHAPGVTKLSVWYENNTTKQGGIQVSSNTLTIPFLEYLSVSKPIPSVALSRTQEVTITTNVTTPAAVLAPHVTYTFLYYDYAKRIIQGSFLNNAQAPATRIGSNQFVANLTILNVNTTQFGIAIFAKSVATSQLIQVSDSALYYSYPAPLILYKNITSPGLYQMTAKNDTAVVTLSVEDNIFASNDIYCRYTQDNITFSYVPIDVLFTISYLYDSNVVVTTVFKCALNVFHGTNATERVDIMLWHNGDNGPPPNNGISSKSQIVTPTATTIMFYGKPAFTSLNSVPINGAVSRPSALNQYVTSDLLLYSFLKIGYAFSVNNGSTVSPISCDFSGTNAKCIVVSSSLEVQVSPTLLTFTIKVTDYNTGQELVVNMEELAYIVPVVVDRAYPYLLPAAELTTTTKQITMVLSTPLSLTYAYKCVVQSRTNTTQYASYNATSQSSTMFTCNVSSFGVVETTTLSLQYISVQPRYNNALTSVVSNTVSISFVAPLRYIVPIAPATSLGSLVVQTKDALPSPPTEFHTHSYYNYSITLRDRTSVVPLQNCGILSNMYVQCLVPNYTNSYPSSPWYVNMDLNMMGNKVISLPKFALVTAPTFLSVQPSNRVLTALVPRSASYITITGTYFFVSSTYQATITYSCQFCMSIVSGTSTQTEPCTTLSGTALSCRTPQFNSATNVTISISMGGTTYATNLMLSIINDNSKQITYVDDNASKCSPYISQTLQIIGNGFENTAIWVKFFDYGTLNLLDKTTAQYVSSTLLTIQSPILWSYNLVYPRSVWFSISFDNGVNYFLSSVKQLYYPTPATMSVTPTSFPAGKLIPSLTINFSNVTVGVGRELVFDLYDSINTNYPLVCSLAYTSTYSCYSNVPLPTQKISLLPRAFAVNKTNPTDSLPVYTPTTSTVQVYQFATVQSVTPLPIVFGLTDTITLSGDFSSILDLASTCFDITKKCFYVRQDYAPKEKSIGLTLVSLTSTSVVLSGLSYYSPNITVTSSRRIQATTVTDIVLSVPGSTSSDDEVLMSTESSTSPFTITAYPKYELLHTYNMDFENDVDTTFTFQATHLTLNGTNFPTNYDPTQVRIKFSNTGNITKWFTGKELNFTLVDSQSATFIAPSFAVLDVSQTPRRFPLAVSLSLSFNNGGTYASITINYLDSFRQPVLTNIAPIISPRMATTIILQGKYISTVSSCTYRIDGLAETTVLATVNTNDTVYGNHVSCLIPASIATNPNVYLINVLVSTIRGENSTGTITFAFHDTLNILKVSPNSGATSGDQQVTLSMVGVFARYDLYVRFSESISQVPCRLIDLEYDGVTSTVNCTTLIHVDGQAAIMVSYDQINWFYKGGKIYKTGQVIPVEGYNYQYIGCPAGYTTANLAEPCSPCPAGTYKPTSGSYACIPCANGTYTGLTGQTNCSLCPLSMGSALGSKTLRDCGCNIGFYFNPNTPKNYMVDTCLVCKVGANCNRFNITIPDALPGYWHTGAKPYDYFKCYPATACLGGGYNNCSAAYNPVSRVCGICQTGYYKWRNACEECTPNAWWKLLLALIIGGIITVVFFAISSAKASHLSSISIAFSFWQIISIFASFDINWPSFVSGSLTAASVINFNIDFLSPQCVFPEMTFVSKWVVISLLPFYFLVAFIILYILGEIRVFITNRTGRFIKIKYMAFREDEDIETNTRDKFEKVKIAAINSIKQTLNFCINILIWIRNFCVWFLKDGATRAQMGNFRNKIINSYTA